MGIIKKLKVLKTIYKNICTFYKIKQTGYWELTVYLKEEDAKLVRDWFSDEVEKC